MEGNDNKKHPAGIDVAVLMLFFNRPKQLAEVFAEVKKARPSKLFLYQDGPRGEHDMAGIEGCRKIVEDIDWQCEVHRNYCQQNQGCDPSEYLSQKWAFNYVDKCIVLEDDDVPSQSFFAFCKEMLDRYADDKKVWMVAGFNAEEKTKYVSSDYFFTTNFSIWGWASWRRVIDTWDATYQFLDDKASVEKIERLINEGKLRKEFLQMCRDHRASGIAYYETIFWSSMILNDALAIMPSRNLINNRGVTADSTHYSASLETTPHRLRRIYTMPRYELTFPLRHPEKVEDYDHHRQNVYRIHAWGHPFIKICYSVEELFLNLIHGNFSLIGKAMKRRIGIWKNGRRYN